MNPNLEELRRLRLEALKRQSRGPVPTDAAPAPSDAAPAPSEAAPALSDAAPSDAVPAPCDALAPFIPSHAPINFVCIRADDLMAFMGVAVQRCGPSVTVPSQSSSSLAPQSPLESCYEGGQTSPLLASMARGQKESEAVASLRGSRAISPILENVSGSDQTSPVVRVNKTRSASPFWEASSSGGDLSSKPSTSGACLLSSKAASLGQDCPFSGETSPVLASRATTPPFGNASSASGVYRSTLSTTTCSFSSRTISSPLENVYVSDQTSPVPARRTRSPSPFWRASPSRVHQSRPSTSTASVLSSRATSPAPIGDYSFSGDTSPILVSEDRTPSPFQNLSSAYAVNESRLPLTATFSSRAISPPLDSISNSDQTSPIRTRKTRSPSPLWRATSSRVYQSSRPSTSASGSSRSRARDFTFLDRPSGSTSRRSSSPGESDASDPEFLPKATFVKKNSQKRGSGSPAKQIVKKRGRGRPPKAKPSAPIICPICRESASGKLSNTSCGHFFHNKCLNEWVNTPGQKDRVVKVCPSCGSDFYMMDVNPIFL